MDHIRVETSIVRPDDRYSFHMGKHGPSVEYAGVKWHPRKDGYYQNKNRGLLHRYVWAEANGSIPRGMHVHHKNHIKSDNRLENLALLRRTDHLAEHEEHRNSVWHSKGGKASWRTAEYREYTCQECGKPFESRTRAVVPKWCSDRCRSVVTSVRAREERVCCVCGSRFSCVKYQPTRTCSRRCTSLYAYTRRGKGVRPDGGA